MTAEQQAKELKEKGNQFYKQGKFIDALKLYSDASQLQPQDPVYHSNISAVQYEIGQYQECIKSSNNAITLLSPPHSPNPSLLSRLLFRKAKSHYFINQYEECKNTLNQLSTICKENGITNTDTDGGLEKALINSNLPSTSLPLLSFFRSPPDTRTFEYFMLGQDKFTSLFSGYFTSVQKDRIENSASQEEFDELFKTFKEESSMKKQLLKVIESDEKLGFMIGGIGDSRHLFASLLDIDEMQSEEQKEILKTKENRIHFTLVDINGAIVARDLVMMYILKNLSVFSAEQMKSDIVAIELVALMYYTFLSAVMPGYLYEQLIKIIHSLIHDLENNSLPHWLSVDDHSRDAVLFYLKDWLDVQVDTLTMAKKMNTKKLKENSGEIIKGVPEQLKENETAKALKQMLELSDSEIMNFPFPGKTAAEKRKLLTEALSNNSLLGELDAGNKLLPGLTRENIMYKDTSVLLPPEQLLERHTEIRELWRLHVESYVEPRDMSEQSKKGVSPEELQRQIDEIKEHRHADELPKAAKAAQSHILNTYKPNPTFWDPVWAEIVGKEEYLISADPFDVIHYICGDPYAPPRADTPTRIFDYLSPIFEKVALVLGKFGEKSLVLEWKVADVFKTCWDIARNGPQRIERGFAVKYDRIYVSNIPDYTGGNLPISYLCAPIMKTDPHTYVSFNVLLNPNLFKTFEDYVRTYTLLPMEANEKYLAMKHLQGDHWGEYPKFQPIRSPLSFNNLASQDELTTWLYRIFLYIVLPRQRPGLELFRIDYPQTLVSFVARLADIGYPHHWLASVLDSLLEGSIKTKARPPPNSLNLNYALATISTRPFIADLELAVASLSSSLPFLPLSPISTSFVELSFTDKIYVNRDDDHSCVVALFFGSREDVVSLKTLRALRDKMVNDNSEGVLLSTLSWDYKLETMKFKLATSKLEKMLESDWYVRIVRVDTYAQASDSFFQLKKLVS